MAVGGRWEDRRVGGGGWWSLTGLNDALHSSTAHIKLIILRWSKYQVKNTIPPSPTGCGQVRSTIFILFLYRK